MIIDNVDAFKSWLAKLLEPICDADPSALANYVVALVKKDKPEKELKALCADQLDVFLQKETMGFVDKLFECLSTKNYLGPPAAKEAPKEEVRPAALKSELAEAEAPEEERESRRRRSPLRNRVDYNESRSREDRRREERKRRDLDRHGKSGGGDAHRERERHERRGGCTRGRSYSRSRSRSGSRGKSRDKEHRGGRDFKSKLELERKESDCYTSASSLAMSGPQQHQQHLQHPPHPPPLLPLPTPPHPYSSSCSSSLSSSCAVATPAHLPDSTTDSWCYYGSQRQEQAKAFSGKGASHKQRCRDYDEKGFCVRGDLCPFDHGSDPLVVDDVTVMPSCIIPFPPPPVLPPPPRLPPQQQQPPPQVEAPPPPLRMLPPPYGQPPPPGVFPMTDPFDPEGYNPESPALTPAGRHPYRHFIPRVQTQRCNLIGLTSSSTSSSSSLEGQGSRAANIVIQTEPAAPASNTSSSSSSSSRFQAEQDSRKRSVVATSAEGPANKKPWMDKSSFSSQAKGGFPKRFHYVNTKLEVRKVPRELNNITKLNEHFSKFGTIVNIQVVFGGDPEAALIQYTKNEEARRAISSIEAVLNNRFIRVHWHREPGSSTLQQQQQSTVGQTAGVAPQQQQQQQQQQQHVHMGIKQHNAAAYVLNKTVAKHRPAALAGTTSAAKVDGSNPNADAIAVVAALSSSSSQKMLYPPVALKSSSKSLGRTAKALEAQEALKKKQEALKLQQDMRKKKQEMLKTQIDCQKALINRLEKNRGMKPEERAMVMKTLKELTEKISQLQNEMTPTSQGPAPKTNHGQAKTKTDVGPAHHLLLLLMLWPMTRSHSLLLLLLLQAQKELLDAELDFHKKLSSGEDTTDLKRKLGQLQVEATRLGLLRPPAARGRGRGKAAASLEAGAVPGGRGRGRSRDVMSRGTGNLMVVDHRPRALAVLGLRQEEREELLPHFVKYGEVEDVRHQDSSGAAVVTFKTRSEAENAANQGAKFKGRLLHLSWYNNNKAKTSTVTPQDQQEEHQDQDQQEATSYLPGEEEQEQDEEEEEEDDDEDDECESRSWRR
ncbi:RNA-binding protein 27 isoform X5 [Nelusetta ayraudi]|uniref:RNA-binding protein 27 isoform X5 n=1 Tax=Nelusetta ayraudi TaxID=303726 RepID=UPI003F6F91AA